MRLKAAPRLPGSPGYRGNNGRACCADALYLVTVAGAGADPSLLQGDRWYPRVKCVAVVSVFLDRAQDQLFDILDCEVIESLDIDRLADVRGLVGLTWCCRISTLPPSRSNF
jgi:hypothetical protein